MAKRFVKTPKPKKVKINKYFFIDRRLYRVLRTNSPANLMEAWSFEDDAPVTMLYTDFRRLAKKAITTKRAADILNISKRTLTRAYMGGHIPVPPQSYSLNGAENMNYHWWGLEDILVAHDYFMSVHRGRPRNDGAVVPNQHLPTRAEIIARMTDQVILYSKEGDRFVPTYAPPEF